MLTPQLDASQSQDSPEKVIRCFTEAAGGLAALAVSRGALVVERPQCK